MLKGVNLGNWLALEKWMSPELYEGTSAEDETDLCEQLEPSVRQAVFRVHRDTWIESRDFAYLASRGIELVRIPIPWFIFGDHDPYVGGIGYVDRAFDWAERYGLKILLDLHTVPESQNGFDNGGLRGVCRFHKDPAYAAIALDVLERLAIRYRGRPALWGIEVLNEPVSPEHWALIDVPKRFPPTDPARAAGSEGVPTAFLRQFYADAYARIRGQDDDVTVVFHDGFRMSEWPGYLDAAPFENVVVDTHLYLVERALAHGNVPFEELLAYVDAEFGGTIAAYSPHFPILVGEWAIDPYSADVYALPERERIEAYRRLAAAHLRAFEGAVGWCYWSARLHTVVSRYEAWDLLKAIEGGLMPPSLAG